MSKVRCSPSLTVLALPDVPRVHEGDRVHELVGAALSRAELTLQDGDVIVVTSKVLSRAQGRFVDVSTVAPSAVAAEIGLEIGKDPRLVELILGESESISRTAKNVLIVRHKLGFVSANAGIDMSNARPDSTRVGAGPWALLLPEDPDGDAEQLRRSLSERYACKIGVVVSDSHGRPFRFGTVGAAVGVAGVPALNSQIGEPDLDGRKLEYTITALADQIAAAADLVAGQADEGRPFVLVRGLSFAQVQSTARDLLRPIDQDLYR
jgi:coenzyme F420-0:L-glutamate ligase/coenzyme F420-1:gamma-L-glutamate ligase